MSFVNREITLQVTLGSDTLSGSPNSFAGTGAQSVTIKGLRTSVRIQNSGQSSACTAQVRVWGLQQSIVNQLATLGLAFNLVPRNAITISAGDAGVTPSVVFSGTILYAYADYAGQPDVPFVIEAQFGIADAAITIPPTSIQGWGDVAQMMEGLARQMSMGFQNNGVTSRLRNPRYAGSAKNQADQLARDAKIVWSNINGNTMAIWPLGGNRSLLQIPIISPETGMIGYPAFTQQGIVVSTIFDPAIAFGGFVKVISSALNAIRQAQPNLASANAFPTQWSVYKLDLELDALLPGGQWKSVVYAYNTQYSKAVIAPSGGIGHA